jgi:hypothetical protein
LSFIRTHRARAQAIEQPACDEGRIGKDERRLHLTEQMQVIAAHRQNVVSTFHMNLRGFVVMPLHVADCAHVDDD